jgi:hopene-associated glycosyltransferase HpnB
LSAEAAAASAVILVSLFIWLYLIVAHGRFWRSVPELVPVEPAEYPPVSIIVPARDEVETIVPVMGSLLAQKYAGPFQIFLVDDNSSDGTGPAAAEAAAAYPPGLLTILTLRSKEPGWTGKLWALSQGVTASHSPLILFTDADIVHDPRHLSTLMAKLEQSRLDLVSEMVHLNCTSLAERALVPAFVYFFQMLFPFRRVNDPRSSVAAAAGGTMLIRRAALERSGGIDAIKNSLIDDVALAKSVKKSGAIFLGHSGLAASIRPYPDFADLWRMIARTAFTQLRYSAALLVLTVVGLALVWWVPAAAMVFAHGWRCAAGAAGFALSAGSFLPTLARYGRSPAWALALPLIALFYMAATVGSALDHWRGRGARWKSRAYGAD